MERRKQRSRLNGPPLICSMRRDTPRAVQVTGAERFENQ
jgi:hypothetical protein